MNGPTSQPLSQPEVTETLLNLLAWQEELRNQPDLTAFRLFAANRLSLITKADQALLVEGEGKSITITAASNVPLVDRDSPYLRWLKSILADLKVPEGQSSLLVTARDLKESETASWSDWLPETALWLPISAPGFGPLGGLWLYRESPWTDADLRLLEQAAGTMGHAWGALLSRPKHSKIKGRSRRRLIMGTLLGLCLAAMAIPVPLSVLAPAEVIPRDGNLVTAPVDGVIADVLVTPHAEVKDNEPILQFDETDLQGRLNVAREERELAAAELRSAQQGAFGNRERNAEVALLEVRLEIRAAEVRFLEETLRRLTVRSPRAGIAVFRDANDLEGQPVRTGQALIQVADPLDTELRMDLSVADAIELPNGAPVRLFLDRDPLSPIDAELISTSFAAEAGSGGAPSYRLIARFKQNPGPRLGLRGTARISGKTVPLAVYLFRRPFSALRQRIGW
ncbi:MAG: efflux RND transporter periplasmic adaptor subunit [Magnetovibrionaceae bacterium]